MELSLRKVDLHQVGAMSNNAIRLLPGGKGKVGRLAIGDHSGNVWILRFYKGETQVAVKTSSGSYPVSAFTLKGANVVGKEKIFVGCAQIIAGFSKKGSQFFRFETTLTETIHGLHVEGNRIWTIGEYLYNTTEDCQDLHFYMCPDKINCMLVTPISGAKEPETILGCQDRLIRIIRGSECIVEFGVPGPVTALCHYPVPQKSSREAIAVIYGTENGFIGELVFKRSTSCVPDKGWVIQAGGADGGSVGGVICLTAKDVTADSVADIAVGRDDGSLEVWSFDVASAGADGENPEAKVPAKSDLPAVASQQLGHDKPRLAFSYGLGESVTGVVIGPVLAAGYDDLICSTFSGRIVVFTSSPIPKERKTKSRIVTPMTSSGAAGAAGGGGGAGAAGGDVVVTERDSQQSQQESEAAVKKIRTMRSEIERLQERVAKTKAKLRKSSKKEAVFATSSFSLRDRFFLDTAASCFVFTLEGQVPLQMVALTSTVAVDLLDDRSDAAILSVNEADKGSQYKLLAVYRCQDSTTRLRVRLRTAEGVQGEVTAFVVPRISPKVCKTVTHQILPLWQHKRVHSFATDAPDFDVRPLSELVVMGGFSVAEVHAWLRLTLPDIPERLTEDVCDYQYFSSISGSVLVASFKAGEASFKSENLTSLAIIKESLTRKATESNRQISSKSYIHPDSASFMAGLLFPQLQSALLFAQNAKLSVALKELQMHESNLDFLPEDQREILSKSDEYLEQSTDKKRVLEYLIKTVEALHVNWSKFRERQPNLAGLRSVLTTKCTLDRLQDYFTE